MSKMALDDMSCFPGEVNKIKWVDA